MTWTYDPTELPSANTSGLSNATDEQKKNAVRVMSGDADTSRQLISDEAIHFFLSTEPNVYYAAARTVMNIIHEVASGGMEDQKVGETRIRMQRISELKVLVQDLRMRGSSHMLPSAGGIFIADRDAEEQDTSKIQPFFKRNQFDFVANDTKLGDCKQ